MPAAQRDKVGAIGGATVFPMGDVVNVQAVTKTTSRNHTTPVTVLDEATDPAGHDPLIPTQIDRGAIAFEHRAQLGVTGVQQPQMFGQHRSQMKRQQVRSPTMRARFQVRVDPVAVRRRKHCLARGQRCFGHRQQAVHQGHPRNRGPFRQPGAGLGEQVISSGFHRVMQQRTLIGGKVTVEPPRTIFVLTHRPVPAFFYQPGPPRPPTPDTSAAVTVGRLGVRRDVVSRAVTAGFGPVRHIRDRFWIWDRFWIGVERDPGQRALQL